MTSDERLADLQAHPERHKHKDLNELTACCLIDGAVDLSLLDAHARYAPVRVAGANRCDVREGPCSCGGWH